jgi:hypothetical protein
MKQNRLYHGLCAGCIENNPVSRLAGRPCIHIGQNNSCRSIPYFHRLAIGGMLSDVRGFVFSVGGLGFGSIKAPAISASK